MALVRLSVLFASSLLLITSACDATFIDLRPDGPPQAVDGGVEVDSGVVIDGGVDSDAGSGQDTGPATDMILSSGAWGGRGSYQATGTATLIRRASGGLELVFSDDFSTAGVPGPVILLSRRDAIGSSIDPTQDLELGPLVSMTGAQTYAVPAGGDDRMYAWVFCKPFGVEISRAVLEAP